jgi:hypothetical protein
MILCLNLKGLIGTINALSICVGALLANVLGIPEILGSETLWYKLFKIYLYDLFSKY